MSRKKLVFIGLIIIVVLLGVLACTFMFSGQELRTSSSLENTQTIASNTNTAENSSGTNQAAIRPAIVDLGDVVIEVPDDWTISSHEENSAVITNGTATVTYDNRLDQRAEEVLVQVSGNAESFETEVCKISYNGYVTDNGFFAVTNSGDTGSIQITAEGISPDETATVLKCIQYKHR